MNNIDQTCQTLTRLLSSLQSEPLRFYGGSFSDWERGSTGGQTHACIYLLIRPDKQSLQYVGQTVDLGARLAQHDKPQAWSEPRWNHVRYLSAPELDNERFRVLFESFCIHILNPSDNGIRTG